MRAATLALAWGLGLGLGAGTGSAQAGPRSTPRFEVERRDGTRLAGHGLGWADGTLRLTVDGRPVEVPHASVALVTAAPGEPSVVTGSSDVLVLATEGPSPDRLSGLLVGGGREGVDFALPGSGALAVRFDVVERVLPATRRPLDRLLALEGERLDDRVWLLREGSALDNLSGIVDRMDATEVVLDGSLGRSVFELEEVAAVVLAGTAPAPAPDEGAPVLVALSGGSRFAARLLAIEGGTVRLGTGFAGRVELPLVVVSDLVARGPDVVPLAALEPVEVAEHPAIGGPQDVLHPWQRDLSVSGQPLVVGGVARATGLGVHAHSRLVWAVPEGAARLRVTAGLCDEVTALPADASMTFALLVDGEPRAESGILREGDPPVVLVADGLADAERVALVAGDAGDLDAGDRGAWADALFLLE